MAQLLNLLKMHVPSTQFAKVIEQLQDTSLSMKHILSNDFVHIALGESHQKRSAVHKDPAEITRLICAILFQCLLRLI